MPSYQYEGGKKILLHALCSLASNIDTAHGVKLGLSNMQVAVEAAAFTPLRDNGKIRLRHEAHEQQNIDVACFSKEQECQISHTKQKMTTDLFKLKITAADDNTNAVKQH